METRKKLTQSSLGINAVKFLRVGSATTNHDFYKELSQFELILNEISMHGKCERSGLPLVQRPPVSNASTQFILNDDEGDSIVDSDLQYGCLKNDLCFSFQYNKFDDIVAPIQSFVHQVTKTSPEAGTPTSPCKHCQDTDVVQTELLANIRLWRTQMMSSVLNR